MRENDGFRTKALNAAAWPAKQNKGTYALAKSKTKIKTNPINHTSKKEEKGSKRKNLYSTVYVAEADSETKMTPASRKDGPDEKWLCESTKT